MFKFLLYLIICAPLLSGTTGKIKGTVIDSNSHLPIAGCTIFLDSTQYGTATDSNGDYHVLNINPGLYNLHAQMMGYDKYIIEGIEVNIDLTTTINIELNASIPRSSLILTPTLITAS